MSHVVFRRYNGGGKVKLKISGQKSDSQTNKRERSSVFSVLCEVKASHSPTDTSVVLTHLMRMMSDEFTIACGLVN